MSRKTIFRLHYLDWLQGLAVLGVFLFHAVHPFDNLADWHVKNVNKSVLAHFAIPGPGLQ